MTPDAIRRQADALAAYLHKAGTRGASFWLDSKGFTAADRAVVLLALSDRDEIDEGRSA